MGKMGKTGGLLRRELQLVVNCVVLCVLNCVVLCIVCV